MPTTRHPPFVSIHASASATSVSAPPTIAILGSGAATGDLRVQVGGLDTVAHSEPRVEGADVELDRVRAEVEVQRDLLVAPPGRDQREDLAVAGAEPRIVGAMRGKQLLPSGRQHGAPGGGVGERGEDVLGGVALQQNPARSMFYRAADGLLARGAAEQHDP